MIEVLGNYNLEGKFMGRMVGFFIIVKYSLRVNFVRGEIGYFRGFGNWSLRVF